MSNSEECTAVIAPTLTSVVDPLVSAKGHGEEGSVAAEEPPASMEDARSITPPPSDAPPVPSDVPSDMDVRPALPPIATPVDTPSPALPIAAASTGSAAQAIKTDDVHETSPNGQRYVKLDVLLGSGAYKDVWRAYDTREGIEVAWNVIKLKRIPVNDRKRVKNEVLLLKEIEHKNIIKYHSSWIDREKQCVIFITEIMSSGSLKEYVTSRHAIAF